MTKKLFDLYDVVTGLEGSMNPQTLSKIQMEISRLYLVERRAITLLDEFTEHSSPMINNQAVKQLREVVNLE